MSNQDTPTVEADDIGTPDTETPDNEKICDYADVVLVVGPDKVPIGVDSRCLRRASKVFNTMFIPPWMESTKLLNDSASPAEVTLPEDDARTMYLICCVVHHRSDLVPSDISASEILQIAIAVDKYDMLTALKYAAGEWVKKSPASSLPESEVILYMGHLLAASYLFREAEQFQSISLQLMLSYSGSYREIAKSSLIVDVLGAEIPVLLEERRTQIRTEIHHTVTTHHAQGACGYGSCTYGAARTKQYSSLLSSQEWTPGTLRLRTICSMVQDVEDSKPSLVEYIRDLRIRKSCQGTKCKVDGRRELTNKVELLKTTLALSYEWVRAEQVAMGNKE